MQREKNEFQEKNQKRKELYQRLEECDRIVHHFDECPLWKGLVEDLKVQCVHLDTKWYLAKTYENFELLKTMRVSIEHVLALKQRYQEEYDGIKREIASLDFDETQETEKDFDNEGKVEG